MTIKTLASRIAKIEGKKSQARIGDIREILKIIVQIELEAIESSDAGALHCLCDEVNKALLKPKTKKGKA